MRLSDKVYNRVFRKRGVSRTIAEERDAFVPFEQGDVETLIEHAPDLPSARALRAGGVLMRRWPVPEAQDQDITMELRPDWPIWTGGPDAISTTPHKEMGPIERKRHVRRSKVTGEMVRRGVTDEEYERFAERFPRAATHAVGKTDDGREVYGDRHGLAMGADHDGEPCDRRHLHIEVTKYQMSASKREEGVEPGTPHAHRDFYDRRFYPWATIEERDAMRHQHVVWQHLEPTKKGNPRRPTRKRDATLVDVLQQAGKPGRHEISMSGEGQMTSHMRIKEPPLDELHRHTRQVKSDEEIAKRLSINPRSLERLEDAERVFFVLEGSLKSAAVVTASEVEFSVPSVTCWNNNDLEPYAAHLQGKRVYVVCDSDWDRTAEHYANPDLVINQTLLARDRLRDLGVDAHAAAPPPKCGQTCEHETRQDREEHKNGVDDFLGPWDENRKRQRNRVDDLLVIDRQARDDLFGILLSARVLAKERGQRVKGAERDAKVLRALAMYGSKDGRCRSSFEAIARWAGVSEDAVGLAITGRRDAEGSLVKYGAVVITESFEERVGYRFRQKFSEWTGEVQVVDEFRATTPDPLPTIREFEARNR